MSYYGEDVLRKVLKSLEGIQSPPVPVPAPGPSMVFPAGTPMSTVESVLQGRGIDRIVTHDGESAIARPIVNKLLAKQYLIRDNHGVLHFDGPTAKLNELTAAEGMCDFCDSETAPHTIIVPDFNMPGTDAFSTAGWAACDVCYDLVQREERKALFDRSVAVHGGNKFVAGWMRKLHDAFWKAYETQSFVAGTAAAALDFIEGKIGQVTKATPREKRISALKRLINLSDDEMSALQRGDLAYGHVSRKLDYWRKANSEHDRRIMMEMALADKPVMPPGTVPHWQAALDAKFGVVAMLDKAVKQIETNYTQTFANAVDVEDPAAVRKMSQEAHRYREFKHFGFQTDLVHMRQADVYSFNADTMHAIMAGMQSIPHDTPLSAVDLPNKVSGFFWFAEPYPIASSPIASDHTDALLWGWDTVPFKPSSDPVHGNIFDPSVDEDPAAEQRLTLRFSAYVKDHDGKVLPSTKWIWPTSLTFHEMIGLNLSMHRKLYGPGGEYEHVEDKVGEDATMKCIAELSLYFLMACVWFKQKVVVQVDGHIERHARKRYQREHKLKESPTVRVIALRASMKSSETGERTSSGEARHYAHRWVVDGHNRLQPCGPGHKDRKLIWISPYVKGSPDAPLKEKSKKVFAVIR